MASRRTKPRHNGPLTSDNETDTANFSDAALPPPPTRTNAELNHSVLRRHNPSITSILSIAPYAVVYTFNPSSSAWEKSGVEGTLFVCQLTPSPAGAERYNVLVLNRRGLENFESELVRSEDVEITEEYVILQVKDEEGNPEIMGLWIFSEPPPSSTANMRALTAQIIQDCTTAAEASRRAVEEHLRQQAVENEEVVAGETELEESVPMGRQLSLQELFGQQREQDAGWSVHMHHEPSQPMQSQGRQTQFTVTPDTEFFRSGNRTLRERPSHGQASVGQVHSGPSEQNAHAQALLGLFQR
ncbi:hypothetical protein H2199_004462 [Coniosporium tulheliwenetii]|uniref:Uncharacterized protein n=1 Tax=Coniosporium tulheliwenetii TaxID=3383036 RepID=A0ACC2Z5D9_9PEZI|nr:hypothetical protein H2199_004462 [Cladosporium sp. JES 115]